MYKYKVSFVRPIFITKCTKVTKEFSDTPKLSQSNQDKYHMELDEK